MDKGTGINRMKFRFEDLEIWKLAIEIADYTKCFYKIVQRTFCKLHWLIPIG